MLGKAGESRTVLGNEEKEAHQGDVGDEQDRIELRWKDYLALFIATLETVAVPLIVLMVVILLVALVASR